MNIWAHRGCSYRFPENTLTSFREACRYNITGIELDVQMTRDGELVVIHDEWVDRTTDGVGEVRAFTLTGLRALHVVGAQENERIPTFREVLSLMYPYAMSRGLKINIELKTGKFMYPGIERETVRMVEAFGMMDHVIFSSFNPKSVVLVRRYAPAADVGMLARTMKNCLRGAQLVRGAALHPCIDNVDPAQIPAGVPVRVWSEAPTEVLFPDRTDFPALDLAALAQKGVTDLFTNVPERYCSLYASQSV